MSDIAGTPEPPSLADQLHGIVDEMLEPHGKRSSRGNALLTNDIPPFDFTQPNQHETKAAFLREKRLVEDSLRKLEKLVEMFLEDEPESERNEAIRNLRRRLESKIRQSASNRRVESAFSLVRKNFADTGAWYCSLFVFSDLVAGLRERLKELQEQEERFWNINHRAPDYYAREIALRLARLYAREVGEFPTLGTSPVDGSPSTAFTRALQQVFQVLGIKSQPRSPAEWAVGQLTEEDLKPVRNSLLRGRVPNALAQPDNTLVELSKMFSGEKRSED